MTWVRLDDRFPSHRKVALLTDRAFRLHVSAICWCSENLTDGHISDRELTLVTRGRGVKATAQQLEAAGVWDRVDSGWVIHDYLEYNPSREQVLLERKKNAERQERFRQRKNGKPTPPSGSDDASRNGGSNGVTRTGDAHEDDANATRRRHEDDVSAYGNHSAADGNSQATGPRNGVSNEVPSRPVPTPTPYMAEVEGESARSSARKRHSLSLIHADWTPSDADRTEAAADIQRLGPAAVRTATTKFIRHQQSRGTRAADFGPAWVTWLSRERAETQGTFLVGLPGGATPTPPSFADRMAELDAVAARDDRDHDTA
jgi:hypothetical protein